MLMKNNQYKTLSNVRAYSVGKIAEKTVCRSVFWQNGTVFGVPINKNALLQFLFLFCPLGRLFRLQRRARCFYFEHFDSLLW